MKLNEEEKKIFEDFLSFLQLHPELKKWELSSEPVLSLPDLEIDPSQRLVRCNQKEVGLTAKEYSFLRSLSTWYPMVTRSFIVRASPQNF